MYKYGGSFKKIGDLIFIIVISLYKGDILGVLLVKVERVELVFMWDLGLIVEVIIVVIG